MRHSLSRLSHILIVGYAHSVSAERIDNGGASPIFAVARISPRPIKTPKQNLDSRFVGNSGLGHRLPNVRMAEQ